jgi:hypothetical protein
MGDNAFRRLPDLKEKKQILPLHFIQRQDDNVFFPE